MEQNNAIQHVPAANSDLVDVMQQYLNLFTTHQFKQFLAPNSVVDWFGRTIRGTNKIHDFLKYEIGSQYEHKHFEHPEKCDPIESKPSHYASQKVETASAYEIPKLNIIAGISSLRSYAESDVDHSISEDELDKTETRATTPVSQQLTNTQLTPPTSRKKMRQPYFSLSDSDCDTDDEEAGISVAKRARRMPMPAFSYLRHFPRYRTNKKQIASKDSSTAIDSSDDETDLTASTSSINSQLNYLEVSGLLQHKTNISFIGSEYTHLGRDSDISIRISYRRNTEQQLQFMLIIYEHKADANAPPRIKRNLMSEFADCEEEIIVITDRATTQLESTDVEASELSVAALRTPTKLSNTPPQTPKRKPRLHYVGMSSSALKRSNESPITPKSTPKRNAARCLRL